MWWNGSFGVEGKSIDVGCANIKSNDGIESVKNEQGKVLMCEWHREPEDVCTLDV